jgi:hypothetical protein
MVSLFIAVETFPQLATMLPLFITDELRGAQPMFYFLIDNYRYMFIKLKPLCFCITGS